MRAATIRTEHADSATVAAAVTPDNTDEMESRVEEGAVVTTIKRETTTGLQSTVDDYVVNVDIASAIAECARAFDGSTDNNASRENRETTDTNPRTNTNDQ